MGLTDEKSSAELDSQFTVQYSICYRGGAGTNFLSVLSLYCTRLRTTFSLYLGSLPSFSEVSFYVVMAAPLPSIVCSQGL